MKYKIDPKQVYTAIMNGHSSKNLVICHIPFFPNSDFPMSPLVLKQYINGVWTRW